MTVLADCICREGKWTEIDGEFVCIKCGVVSDVRVTDSGGGQIKTHLLIHEEKHLGSRDYGVAKKLKLRLPKKYDYAVQRQDRYAIEFSKICDDLVLPRHISVVAWGLFTKMRYMQLGTGKLALFCLHYACRTAGRVLDERKVVDMIRSRFGLKRRLLMNRAIYEIQPIAQEMNLITITDESKHLLKKHVKSNHVVDVVRTLDNLNKTPKSIKAMEAAINAYK